MIDGWLALIVIGSMFAGWCIGVSQVLSEWRDANKSKISQNNALMKSVRYTRRDA